MPLPSCSNRHNLHKLLAPAGTGTGGWEAALTNTLSPGDKIVTFRYGQFSHLWIDMMQRMGLDVTVIDRCVPAIKIAASACLQRWLMGACQAAVHAQLATVRCRAVSFCGCWRVLQPCLCPVYPACCGDDGNDM